MVTLVLTAGVAAARSRSFAISSSILALILSQLTSSYRIGVGKKGKYPLIPIEANSYKSSWHVFTFSITEFFITFWVLFFGGGALVTGGGNEILVLWLGLRVACMQLQKLSVCTWEVSQFSFLAAPFTAPGVTWPWGWGKGLVVNHISELL